MKKQYLILIIVLAVLAGGFIYVGWQLWYPQVKVTPQTPFAPTTLVYEDLGLGFSFSYPSDWQLTPCNEDFCESTGLMRDEKKFLVKNGDKILIDPLGKIGGDTASGEGKETTINGQLWRLITAESFAARATSTLIAKTYYRYEAVEDLGLLPDPTTRYSSEPERTFRIHLFLGEDSPLAINEAGLRLLNQIVQSLVIKYPILPLAPQDSPTGEWERYVNTGFYIIYYPKGWCLRGGSSASFTSFPCGDRPPGPRTNELVVQIDLNNLAHLNILTLEDWLEYENKKGSISDAKETILDGERAVWANVDYGHGFIDPSLMAARNNTLYRIHYRLSGSELKAVLDTMISSFRFMQ